MNTMFIICMHIFSNLIRVKYPIKFLYVTIHILYSDHILYMHNLNITHSMIGIFQKLQNLYKNEFHSVFPIF